MKHRRHNLTLLEYWRNEENHAKLHKRVATNRWYLTIESALKRKKIRYWKFVSFWNPYHKGARNNIDAGFQWAEFVIALPNGRVGAILVNIWGLTGGPHKYQKRAMETKKRFLDERKIPWILLDKTSNTMEYMFLISKWIKSQENVYREEQNLEFLRYKNFTKPIKTW